MAHYASGDSGDEDDGGLEHGGGLGGEGMLWVDDARSVGLESVSEMTGRGGMLSRGSNGRGKGGRGRRGRKRVERGEGERGEGEGEAREGGGGGGGGGSGGGRWSKAVFHRILKERAAGGSQGEQMSAGEAVTGGGTPGGNDAAVKGTLTSPGGGTPSVKGAPWETEADLLIRMRLVDLVSATPVTCPFATHPRCARGQAARIT